MAKRLLSAPARSAVGHIRDAKAKLADKRRFDAFECSAIFALCTRFSVLPGGWWQAREMAKDRIIGATDGIFASVHPLLNR
jgi:hypothetical protein